MLKNIAEIENEIATLEAKQATLPVIEKLAMLYIVRDHNQSNANIRKEYSRSAGEQSDFIKAATNAPFDKLLDILNEHMEAVRIIYPKEYAEVMRLISEL